jgi:hypothetical protein
MAENKVIQLQKQILKLTETINKNGKATKEQAENLKKLEAQYAKLNNKLMPQYRNRHDEVTAAIKKSNKFTNDALKSTKNFGTRIEGAIKTLSAYGIAFKLISTAQRIFSELTLGSIKQAIQFQKELANLGAVAGASSEEVERLGKNALDVAGATKFTAQEIVGLQTELSKLGFTSEEVVESTKAIAFTAQALNAPLNAVAEQTGKVINQFDLLIEQAGFVGDVLVTSINNSALSFETFGTAIQYIGPIAKNLGLTFEQTAGAMAVLADNGFTASRVGTGLRAIFTELGKTSADVEQSLNDLAEQNISLSEAVDLVGKRNAAQLITLLDNIDAIEEGNSKYYEQGRALESAAKQADTFSGQMEILTSNFREFQIQIGKSVVESDLLIGVLDLLFEKGARTARGFKLINEIGFENLSSSVDQIVNGADLTNVTLEVLGSSIQELEKAQENLQNRTGGFWKEFFLGTRQSQEEFGKSQESSEDLLDSYNALFDVLERLSDERVKNSFIVAGQKEAEDNYKSTLEDLITTARDGVNVNKEANEAYRNIQDDIKSYEDGIKDLNDEIKENNDFLKQNKDLDDVIKISIQEKIKSLENEVTQYESSIKSLKGYGDQINNIIISKKRLQEIEEDRQKKGFKAELKSIKEETKARIDAINERARVETAVAETAEQRADIEAKRTALVSDEYKKQAAAIRDLSTEYDTQKQAIEEAAKSSDKLSKILTSEVFKDAESAFKQYEKEIKGYQEAVDDGIMSEEEYGKAVADSRKALINNINSFKELVDQSPELELFFENLLRNFDYLSTYSKDSDEKLRDNIETIEDYFKALKGDPEFLRQELGKIVDQFIESTTEAVSEFSDVSFENTKNRLEQELDLIERRYSIEEDILKASLDNQLITESQYRAKQIELQKQKVAEENAIERKIFQAEKKQDIADVRIDTIAGVAEAIADALLQYGFPQGLIPGGITAAIIAAQGAAQISAIGQRQFFEKKFAEGGMVNGPSHSQGGVPFTVQGQGGYEMEGGEFVVNKRATAMHRDLLERINSSYRTSPQIGRMKFAQGGIVAASANESVDYLKAIAEATTSTAIGVSKPVRAYVADKDLRTNANERRIRDRNDRI